MAESLRDLLQAAARRHPDAVAVVDEDRKTTYQQLANMANRIGQLLVELGIRPGDRVGLFLEKSTEAVAAVHGVLAAGAAYVPLSADLPSTRLAYMVRDAGIRVLLTGAEYGRWWADLTGPGSPVTHLVCLNGPADQDECPEGLVLIGNTELSRSAGSAELSISPRPDDLAYVLYTSGSTGPPKGVLLTHANALSFVGWAVRTYGLTQVDRLSNHAPLHFDLAVFDIFAAVWANAAVVLVPRSVALFPPELARFVRKHRITVWYSVPLAVSQLVDRGGLPSDGLPDLRLVLFAGEVFPLNRLRRAMDQLPAAGFHNLYGPTETNVCTAFPVPRPVPQDWLSLPIGTPIDGVGLLCRTEDGREAEAGELGELWVRGPTVMRGYLGDPTSTAEVLRAPDPRSPDRIAYRTGDLGRRDQAGCWHFAGRRDGQIKSRGYRIELGEIEAALSTHPAVAESAVVPVPDDDVGNRITAFVVTTEPLDLATLFRYAQRALPGYMVPSALELLPVLPRTSTHKVDYQLLRKLARGE